MINFLCPKCNEIMTVPDSMIGKVERCPTCGHSATVRQYVVPYFPSLNVNKFRAGAMQNAPGAVAALVCGLVGLICAGIILGIIAIVMGTKAKTAIRESPGRYTGVGKAEAGIVLGIIDIAGGVGGAAIWLLVLWPYLLDAGINV